jgi:hypothetical protein
MEGIVISVEPGAVRVGSAVRQIDLPPGVKVGDTVIVWGRTVRKKETRAVCVKETK